MLKKIIKTVVIVVVGVVCLGVLNAYLFTPKIQRQGEIVAYRGGGSLVNYDKLRNTGCTATSLAQSGIQTVENTLDAVASSTSAGARVIHLNVHRTADDELVVFHDWTLDCATDGSGPVQKSTFEQLKNFDAGYGYTSDGGATYPLRGKGYRISRLETFYSRYPTHNFWLNLKNNDHRSFELLYVFVATRKANSLVITTSKGVEWFRGKDPELKVTGVDSVKQCGIAYLIMGWAGIVPTSCRNTILLLPPSKAKYFWGYPDRFASRLQKYDTDVYLWSRHEPVAEAHNHILASGIGVVTSDLNFIRAANGRPRLD